MAIGTIDHIADVDNEYHVCYYRPISWKPIVKIHTNVAKVNITI